MKNNKRGPAEADEDGGGEDEKYEINSMGKTSRRGSMEMSCGGAQGAVFGLRQCRNMRIQENKGNGF